MESGTTMEPQQEETTTKIATKYDTTKRPFGKRDIVGYFFGDLGGNFSFDLINMFMFIYFTQFIGIDLVHYAIIILIIKIFDGISDPIIGMIIDRIHLNSRDKFKPWIIRMAPLLSITMPIMFYDASEWPYGAKIALFLISNLLWTVLYTFVNVPYGALSSVMTTKASERTALSTARSIGGFVPNILYMLFIPMFLYTDVVVNGETRSVFQGELMFPIALLTVVFTIICYYILYRNTEERIIHVRKLENKEKYSFFRSLRDFFNNRAMMGLTLVAFAQILFINGSQQLNTLTFQLYFQDGRLNSFTIIITIIPMIIGATIGNKLVKRYGKKEIVVYPMVFGVATYLLMVVLPISNPFIWLGLLSLASMFSFGLSIYTWAMVADAIDYQEWKNGKRNEGTVYSMYSMIRKLGQGVGAALVPATIAFLLPGLDLNDAATWTSDYANGVKNLSVLFPITGMILVIIAMLLVYNLDKNTLKKIQEDLGNEAE